MVDPRRSEELTQFVALNEEVMSDSDEESSCGQKVDLGSQSEQDLALLCPQGQRSAPDAKLHPHNSLCVHGNHHLTRTQVTRAPPSTLSCVYRV